MEEALAMTKQLTLRYALAALAAVVGLGVALPARGEITDIEPHRAAAIDRAAPERASAQPSQPRRVLIFNTPPHLMDSDPHAGYCIPYGAYALKALGERTGAYEPVVSDDLAMFLPGSIEQFDAVVLNNTSQAWIQPTAADMLRDAFLAHGTDGDAVEQVLRVSLLEFVRPGRGLVGIHFAIGGYAHWPDFQDLFGAAYDGHPWNEEVGVQVDEPGHPLAAAFDGDAASRASGCRCTPGRR